MKKLIIIFFLFSGCAYNQAENNYNSSDIKFSDDLSFEEFRIKLEVYATNAPYPDIDN